MKASNLSPAGAKAGHLHHGVLDKIEGALGFFFGNLIVLGLGMLLIMAVTDADMSNTRWARAGWGLAIVAWAVLDLSYLFRLWHAILAKRRPILLAASVRQVLAPSFMRSLIAIWWLAHFTLGLAAALFARELATQEAWKGTFLLADFTALCYGFAANGFLVEAICAATLSQAVRLRVWRYRTIVDLSLAVAGLILTQHL